MAHPMQPAPYYAPVPGMMVVSTPYVPGHRIVRTVGFTWGLIVRSRGVGGNLMAGLPTIFGGGIKEDTGKLDPAPPQAPWRVVPHPPAPPAAPAGLEPRRVSGVSGARK